MTIMRAHYCHWSLSAKVLDVKQDEVQLQLTIDEGETPVDASSKCWFPVATAYVADGQSGLYSMPERGDLAQLYIPSAWKNNPMSKPPSPSSLGRWNLVRKYGVRPQVRKSV